MKEHIYPILVSERRRLGISQGELAARAGLRREKVNRLENRAEDIGLDDLCRLLDAVGLELHVAKKAVSAPSSKPRLVAEDFRKASFIKGSKAKIANWGKMPR